MSAIQVERFGQAQRLVRRAPHWERRTRLNSRRTPFRPDFRATTVESELVQERARIARDLHDSVSQTLYAIILKSMQARSLRDHNKSAGVQRIVDEILELAHAGQLELRGVLANLRSEWSKSGGLARGLETLSAEMRRRSDIDIRLRLEGDPEIPVTAQEALVSISREALNNVIKHSGADEVDVILKVDAHEMILSITDNGRGFDPAIGHPGHFGVHSMRERAAVVGASLDLLSTPGMGAQVRAIIQL
jgi:signal transduction histidine kinase